MRWEFGPSFGRLTFSKGPAPAAPAPTAKIDVEVTADGIVNNVAVVAVPAYDPAGSNALVELRAYVVAVGSDIPTTPDAFVASPHPFGSVSVAGITTGTKASIALPDVPDGDYFVQVIRGFES